MIPEAAQVRLTPENAVVICVDEKPSIQAPRRAQGYLKLPNRRTLIRHCHDYERNGTSTLFAAAYPGHEVHVVLNTHKPKNDRWLARHKALHFHFTPTRAS